MEKAGKEQKDMSGNEIMTAGWLLFMLLFMLLVVILIRAATR